jgi:hypothetical protein
MRQEKIIILHGLILFDWESKGNKIPAVLLKSVGHQISYLVPHFPKDNSAVRDRTHLDPPKEV